MEIFCHIHPVEPPRRHTRGLYFRGADWPDRHSADSTGSGTRSAQEQSLGRRRCTHYRYRALCRGTGCCLAPQYGHNNGFQAAISPQSAMGAEVERSTRRVRDGVEPENARRMVEPDDEVTVHVRTETSVFPERPRRSSRSCCTCTVGGSAVNSNAMLSPHCTSSTAVLAGGAGVGAGVGGDVDGAILVVVVASAVSRPALSSPVVAVVGPSHEKAPGRPVSCKDLPTGVAWVSITGSPALSTIWVATFLLAPHANAA